MRSASTAATISSIARSTSASVVKRPSEKRRVDSASCSGTPIARRTYEAFVLLDEQADPELLTESFDALELGDFLNPLVGDFGQLLGADRFHEHLERHFLATVVAEPLRQGLVVLDDRAGA